MNLMQNVLAVDSTIFFHAGLWWMFSCMTDGQVRTTENLHLFFSSELLSRDWQPHPIEPDRFRLSLRETGRCVIRHEGQLCRPAQDSSFHYGYGLKLFEITELSTTRYRERSEGVRSGLGAQYQGSSRDRESR